MTRRRAWCEKDMGEAGEEPGETYGICPDCLERHFPAEAARMRKGET
jgi:hypothetical protein